MSLKQLQKELRQQSSKEKAKILGSKCMNCDLTYVPPRMFCERCFEKLTKWIEMGHTGTVHTYTIAHLDVDNSRLEHPTIWAVIKIDGAYGGFVHKLGELKIEDAKIGMRVEAVFKAKEERTGSILDITHFRKAE